MTKRNVTIRFSISMLIYVIVIVLAITIRVYDKTQNLAVYSTFKDLIPLLIAIPAVWLGHTLQRRNSYLNQLRILWSKIIYAVHITDYYFSVNNPSNEDFVNARIALRIAIDEVRGVFKNINENDTQIGLYPFEPIKQIYDLLSRSHHMDSLSSENRNIFKQEAFGYWKDVRKVLLKEFDREIPTHFHSHYANSANEFNCSHHS